MAECNNYNWNGIPFIIYEDEFYRIICSIEHEINSYYEKDRKYSYELFLEENVGTDALDNINWQQTNKLEIIIKRESTLSGFWNYLAMFKSIVDFDKLFNKKNK